MIYVHVLKWPGKSDHGKTVRLPGLPRKIVGASILAGAGIVARKKLLVSDGGDAGDSRSVKVDAAGKHIVLTVPEAEQEPLDTIIKLTLDGPAEDIPAVEVEKQD